MPEPSFITRFKDKWAVKFNGGVRLRFFKSAGNLEVETHGSIERIPNERLVRMVRELAADKTGTVDLQRHDTGRWTIAVRGELSDDGVEQRLRNVLINS